MKAKVIETKELLGAPLKVAAVTYHYEKFDGGTSEPVTKVIVKRNDAVAAVVYNTDTEQYIFVSQFRYSAMGLATGWLTEIMAGVIDEGETPEKALERELQEELGYTPCKMEKIVTFYTSPGYSKEQVYLYYVEVNNNSKTEQGGGLAEENEDIMALHYSLEEVKTILYSNSFNDAKTIIGCQYMLSNQKV